MTTQSTLSVVTLINIPTDPSYYQAGIMWQHSLGIIGETIWYVGMTLSILASTKAGPAISYGLGQCATMIAAIWGVFIWREFRTASKGTGILLSAMFACFAIGIWILVMAKGA